MKKHLLILIFLVISTVTVRAQTFDNLDQAFLSPAKVTSIFITNMVPRIRCSKCGVRVIDVPWTRDGSGFTLLLEAYIMLLAPSMPVKRIAELVSEHIHSFIVPKHGC
jgi:hypothetical protein